MNQDKRFVYMLRSDRNPRRHDVGLTSDVVARLEWHNAGHNEQTVRDRPWHILVSLEFRTAEAAGQFERYLKTGSGPCVREPPLAVTAPYSTSETPCPRSRAAPNAGRHPAGGTRAPPDGSRSSVSPRPGCRHRRVVRSPAA
jgi:predicted GIY-YIG superfamily endonuclease